MVESDQTTEVDDLTVRDSAKDAADWEYILAGNLLGTDWVLPGGDLDTVGEVRFASEKLSGETMKYPEVVLKYSGRHMQVSTFLRRIDPSDIGDIEPSDRIANRIVDIQEDHAWKSVEQIPKL